jgi:hypothetical protein
MQRIITYLLQFVSDVFLIQQRYWKGWLVNDMAGSWHYILIIFFCS